MPISLLASTTKGTAKDGGTSSAINSTGADLVIAAASYYNTSPTVTDSAGNTWTYATIRSGGIYRTRIAYCLAPTTSASHTITWSGSSSYPSIAFAAFSGVDSYDQESGSGGASATRQPGSITPSDNGALLFCSLVTNKTTTRSIDSGFTQLTAVNYSFGNYMAGNWAYLIQGTAAAVNPTWSWTGSCDNASSMLAFLPSAGGGFLPVWAARRSSRIIGSLGA